MSANSEISWTHHTFNPWWGCAKVSPACDHCYAERDAGRYQPGSALWGVDAARREFGDKHWNEPLKWDRAAAKAGVRARVFCASMADVFDKNAPAGARDRLWALIEATPNLDWLLLTKRVGNVARMVPKRWMLDGFPSNIWLGASICNRPEMLRDGPKLKQVPARVLFWSVEPMLGDLGKIPRKLLPDWVIAGGESGPKARPMHPAWVRSLLDQCQQAGVPFHFKQHGEWLATDFCDDDAVMLPSKRTVYVRPDGSYHDGSEGIDFFGGNEKETAWVGKSAAGRLLDGRTWDEFPRSAA